MKHRRSYFTHSWSLPPLLPSLLLSLRFFHLWLRHQKVNPWGIHSDAFGAQQFTDRGVQEVSGNTLQNFSVWILWVRIMGNLWSHTHTCFCPLECDAQWDTRLSYLCECTYMCPVGQHGFLSSLSSQASWGLAQSIVITSMVSSPKVSKESASTDNVICCEGFYIKTPTRTTAK